MSGWRPALKIARRSIRRHLGRSVLIAALIAVPIAGATTMDGLLRTMTGAEHTAYRMFGDADAQLEVSEFTAMPGWQPGGDPSGGEGERDPGEVDVESLLPPGSRIVPNYYAGLLRLTDGDRIVRTGVDVVTVGDELTRHLARVESGRAPRGPDEAMVTEALAERLGLLEDGTLRDGATITAEDGPAVVVTGLAVVPTQTSEEAVVARPDTALREAPSLGETQPPATYLVDLPAGTDADALWPELAGKGVLLTPRAVVTDPDRYPMMTYGRESPLETVGPVALIVGFGLLEVVLLAGAAFAVGARRQVRELGLIAANGGTGKHVGRTVLAQGLTLGLLGTVGGLLFGVAAMYAGWPLWESLTAEEIDAWRFGPAELAVACVVGLLSGLAAALLPAIGVARMRPVDALAQRFRATTRGARLPIAGVVLLAVGAAGVIVSGVLAREEVASTAKRDADALYSYTQPDLTLPVIGVLGGGLCAVVGLMVITSGLVSTLARAAGRLPLSGRLAVRDAGRHRHRTVPAVAAIMIVVAGSVTMAFMFAADSVADVKTQPDDTLIVRGESPAGATGVPAEEAKQQRELLAGTKAMAAKLPDGAALPFSIAVAKAARVTVGAGEDGQCSPGSVGIAEPKALAQALGHAPDAGLRAALDRGTVVSLDECLVAGGKVRTEAYGEGQRSVALPARYEPRPAGTYYYDLPSAFISPAAAEKLGWTPAVDTVVVSHAPTATADDIDAAIVAAEDAGLETYDPNDKVEEIDLMNLALAGGAGLVTLLGVAVTVALSAAESRADLATLAAIGAQPRRRRTLAGAQALVLSVVGTVLGVLLGAVLGFAAGPLAGQLSFVVPWQNLGVTLLAVPLLAVVVATLVTRSKLPMVRRID